MMPLTRFSWTKFLVGFYAAFCIGNVMAAPGSSSQVQEVFKKMIVRQGEGRLELVSAEALKNTDDKFGDNEQRTTEYRAEVRFLQDCYWRITPTDQILDFATGAIGQAKGKGFDWDKFNEKAVNYGSMEFKRGERAKLTGFLIWGKSNNEWIPGALTGRWLETVASTNRDVGVSAAVSPEEAAKQSGECLKNLKYIGLALRTYSVDFNGVLPKNWMEVTNELSGPRNLVCPSDSKKNSALSKIPVKDRGTGWKLIEESGSSYEQNSPEKDIDTVGAGGRLATCKIHGHYCNGEGTVFEKQPDGTFSRWR